MRVADFFIWSQIHYLDSDTDYREFVPRRKRNLGFSASSDPVFSQVPVQDLMTMTLYVLFNAR